MPIVFQFSKFAHSYVECKLLFDTAYCFKSFLWAYGTFLLIINTQLLFLYCEIGTIISTEQTKQGWGAKVIDQISKEIRADFPDIKGSSPRNLRYMVKFAEAYPISYLLSIVQPVAAQIQQDQKVQALPAQME